jgi:hypothetical protein
MEAQVGAIARTISGTAAPLWPQFASAVSLGEYDRKRLEQLVSDGLTDCRSAHYDVSNYRPSETFAERERGGGAVEDRPRAVSSAEIQKHRRRAGLVPWGARLYLLAHQNASADHKVRASWRIDAAQQWCRENGVQGVVRSLLPAIIATGDVQYSFDDRSALWLDPYCARPRCGRASVAESLRR